MKMQENLGFTNQDSYIRYLKSISTLPAGFLVGASRFNFKPMEVDKTLPMNLTIIMTEKPTDSFAATFTRNEFCGGPIIVGRERIKSSKFLQAIVVNNKISNVCPGGVTDRGAGDSESICEEVAKYLKLETKNLVFPSSTGIIGWRLPVKEILDKGVPGAVTSLQKESILPAALGICTTDRYPKVRSYKSAKGWSVVGTSKGAGMIGKYSDRQA
jgi:glutamate N-acetyltransferase/amino-acid N-acetyltransferase